MARAVFLDRDGTITRDTGYTHRIDELELLPGAVDGLRMLSALGYCLVVVSNQSGVARGLFSEDDMHAFNRTLVDRLAESGQTLQAIYCCPLHPGASVPRYRADSPLRKPEPGMLLQAAAEHSIDLHGSFMIGDKKSDVLAGQGAGCRTILLQTGEAGRGEPDLQVQPDWIAADLQEAARIISRERDAK